ncbi:MAG: M15 family metallopeptidase [Fibromonadaceae bacterium]|jgi:D-alanyl-D-alanine dipeptidase|nr:M15 family metallopeptidase [Fibromonadaceae bacterium]
MRYFFCFLFLATMPFAQDTLPLFVPKVPEKPLKFCTAHKQWLSIVEKLEDWEEIRPRRNLVIEMPYATFDNFTGHNLYCDIQRVFLHKDAARKLRAAINLLEKQRPNYKFIVYDAARPVHAQEVMRAAVRGTPWQHFVSSPSTGSIHAYGMAVDVGLLNENNELIDMGLPFDSFAFYAGRKGERQALDQGLLSEKQVENREFLRSIMRQSGWINLQSEWWHFNAAPSDSIRAKYAQPQ